MLCLVAHRVCCPVAQSAPVSPRCTAADVHPPAALSPRSHRRCWASPPRPPTRTCTPPRPRTRCRVSADSLNLCDSCHQRILFQCHLSAFDQPCKLLQCDGQGRPPPPPCCPALHRTAHSPMPPAHHRPLLIISPCLQRAPPMATTPRRAAPRSLRASPPPPSSPSRRALRPSTPRRLRCKLALAQQRPGLQASGHPAVAGA